MKYESLELRPSSGVVDLDAATAWFASKDHAYLDPANTWHLFGDMRAMEWSREREVTARCGLAQDPDAPGVVAVEVPDGLDPVVELAGPSVLRRPAAHLRPESAQTN